MTGQTQAPAIAAADEGMPPARRRTAGQAGPFTPASTPSGPATPRREVCAMLTCTWVTAGDGALVMQWTGQKPEDKPEEMTSAAA